MDGLNNLFEIEIGEFKRQTWLCFYYNMNGKLRENIAKYVSSMINEPISEAIGLSTVMARTLYDIKKQYKIKATKTAINKINNNIINIIRRDVKNNVKK